jgi:hypothetical protein
VDISLLKIRNALEIYKALSLQMTAHAIGTQRRQQGNQQQQQVTRRQLQDEEGEPSGGGNSSTTTTTTTTTPTTTTPTTLVTSTWPFVTLPGFEAQTEAAIANTNARFVSFQPIVSPAQRSQWESFAVEHQDEWISESFEYFGLEYNATEIPITPFIFDSVATPLEERQPSSGPFFAGQYAPIWQIAPILGNTGLINYDVYAFSYFSKVLGIMARAPGEAMLSEVVNLNVNTTLPESFLTIPIMDTLQVPVPSDAVMVGTITAFLPWHDFFAGVLPKTVNGIEIVIRNTCGQVFTLITSKGGVEFWGEGDPHEILLEDFEVMANFTSPIITSIEECQYSLHLFPSREFKKGYDSVGPIIYTGCVIFVFVLTALVFILYDWLVQRRQDKVMWSATRTDMLVSSLFPDAVKDRLMEDMMASAGADDRSLESKKSKDKKGGGGGYGVADANTAGISREEILNTRPIADLFPDCTVMFADIVGFTAWSSEREPPEVFTLLEFVYNSFDKIARRLRVFKVETIGDCYVAVVGLPDTREDHALVMARFARACMSTMTDVVHTLELRLGKFWGMGG